MKPERLCHLKPIKPSMTRPTSISSTLTPLRYLLFAYAVNSVISPLNPLFITSSSMSSSSSLFCGEDAAGIVSCDAGTWISHSSSSLPSTSLSNSLYSCSPSDHTNVDGLIDSEPDHMPDPNYFRRYRDRSVDVTSRQDSINWILKVHAYYHFSPVTAFLSVNYFDRFLSSHSLRVIWKLSCRFVCLFS